MTIRLMSNIRGAVRDFVIKLQEFAITFGARKKIQIMLEYIDIRPGDIPLDVGGNTGKITEAYSRNCKEVVVLEPKHRIVEYGRAHRPHIKLKEEQKIYLCLTNTVTRSWQVLLLLSPFSKSRRRFRGNEESVKV